MQFNEINREASNVPITELRDPSRIQLEIGEVNRYRYKWSQGELDALLINKNSDTLVVSFHGAVDRDTTALPRFERLNTLKQLDVSSLFFGDPTLFMNDKLALAWYTGWQSINMHKLIARWIVQIVEKLNIRNLILTGSSGGGFAAMQVSSYIPNSIVIAYNAQTEISRYLVNGESLGAQRMYLQSVHPQILGLLSDEEVKDMNFDWESTFDDRVSVINRYKNSMKNYIILVENDEEFHFEDHYLPLVKVLDDYQLPGRYRCYTYKGGKIHNPPTMEVFTHYLEESFGWAKLNPPVARAIAEIPGTHSWFDRMSDRISGDDTDYDIRLNDKLFFRDFCAKNNIAIPRLLNTVPEFTSETVLPRSGNFVIKPVSSSSSQGVLILATESDGYRCLRTGNIYNSDSLLEYYQNFYNKYSPDSHQVIIEEKINDRGKFPIPRDFKFYIVGGEVALIQCIDRNRKPVGITWFDQSFNQVEAKKIQVNPRYGTRTGFTKPVDSDLLLNEALRIAGLVRSAFVRVDMYSTPSGPVCGEVTFTPGGPYFEETDIFSQELQIRLGKLWKSPFSEITEPFSTATSISKY